MLSSATELAGRLQDSDLRFLFRELRDKLEGHLPRYYAIQQSPDLGSVTELELEGVRVIGLVT